MIRAGQMIGALMARGHDGCVPHLAPGDDGVPRVVGEFWTSGQRRGHSLHEVPYRACFKPQLPAFFIEMLTRPGDAVLDPFMGRGTTPLQAALMGRRPVGSDANPVSEMLAAPRLRPPEEGEVAGAVDRLLLGARLDLGLRATPARPADAEPLLAFYHPDTLSQLLSVREALFYLDATREITPADEWVRMVVMTRLHGHSSGFLSARSMPPNQAVSAEAQRRINERNGVLQPPFRDVRDVVARKSRQLLRDGRPPPSEPLLDCARADHLRMVEDGSVALTVTSPPFLDVVDYAADNWLRCWFSMGRSTGLTELGHRRVEDWDRFAHGALRELTRVTRPGGWVAFEVGEVRRGKVELDRNVVAAARGTGLEPACVLVNDQEFTKTANCWGVENNRRGTNTNRVVLMRRKA